MKNSPRRRSLIALTLALSGLSVLLNGPAPFNSAAQGAAGERVFENKLPPHIPVKVKVNNLQSPKWPRELEIEVKNTGRKPIYFLSLFIVTDVISEGGRPAGFSFNYGRTAMASIEAVPTPEDVPIEPGGTHVFKIEAKFAKPWEAWANDPGSHMKPKKFTLMFSGLYFGDGTGFGTTDGAPIPSRRASGARCEREGAVSAAPAGAKGPPPRRFKGVSDYLPVSYLPANFFPGEQPGAGRPRAPRRRLLL